MGVATRGTAAGAREAPGRASAGDGERSGRGEGEGGLTRRQAVAGVLRRPVVLVVLAAVVGGAFLRVPLAHVGLPYLRDPDEPLAAHVSSEMLTESRVNAGYYNYPGLMFDLVGLVLVPIVDGDTPTATEANPVAATQTQGNSVSDRPGVLAALRWMVGVLPGLVGIAAAGIVAWLATRRWWAAGAAAGLMALSPLDLAYGRYVTPNALAGATSGLVVLAAGWLLLSSPRTSRYLLAGGAVGLAAAAKYNAALAAVAVVVAHLLATAEAEGWRWRDRREWRAWLSGGSLLRHARMLAAAGAASVAVFVLLNPGVLVDTQLFVDGVRFESEHYRRGHPGHEGDSLDFHLSALWRAFGPALLLAPLALVARDRTVRRMALVAWSFVLPYLVFISSFEVRFARNLLPVTVALAAAMALGAVAGADHARHLWARRATGATGAGRASGTPASLPLFGDGDGDGVPGGHARRPAVVAGLAALAVAVLVWPAVEARATLDAAIPDPWAPAQRWLESHVPAGAQVAVESYGVYVDPERYDVLTAGALIEGGRDAAWYRDRGYALLVASERNYQRFLDEPERFATQATGYRALLEETCTRFAAGPTDEQVLLLDPSCTDPARS